ncbi:MAG: hypothetical protein C0506_03400 [Anaerolinea sp.]|nr:hypothetical protein [Anaerolinea sp.]
MTTQGMTVRRGRTTGGTKLGLIALVATCLALAAALWGFAGPPTMLAALPEWSRVREVLGGTQLADEDAITVASGIAWLALLYLGLSIIVRLGLGLAASLTGQARWTLAGLRITAPLTLPFVRRVVDGALAGVIVINASLHAPLSPAAVTADVTAVAAPVWISPAHASSDVPDHSPATPQQPQLSTPAVPASYTVVPGDSLWHISERFLGDGFRWTDLWALNQQRQMADGRPFVNPNLIYPGWTLELPQDPISPGLTPPALEQGEPTAAAEPTASPAVPDPEPTPEAPVPAAVAQVTEEATGGAGDTASDDRSNSRVERPLFKPPLPGTAALAAVAAVTAGGAAMLLVFRRSRRRPGLRTASERELRPAGAGDAGRVVAVTAALQSALADLDFSATAVLLVRESDRFLEFTLDCPPGDANAIVAARHTLGRQLACVVDGEDESPTRVRLKLSRLSRLASVLFGESSLGQPLVVPVGATESGIYYLNLAATGSVLVAGGRLETRDLLTTWLATLTSLYTAQELAVVADRPGSELLGDALGPLLCRPDGDACAPTIAAIARQLEEAIVQDEGGRHERPTLVAFVGPALDIGDATTELEAVLRQGPEHSIFVVASTEVLADSAARQAFGASVAFEDEGRDGANGGLTLNVPRHPPLDLEPVTVRRQTAHRPARAVGDLGFLPPVSPSLNGNEPVIGGPDIDESADDHVAAKDGAEDPVSVPNEEGAVSHDAEAGEPSQPRPSASVPAMDRQPSLPLTEPGDEDESSAQGGPLFHVRLFGSFRVETAMGEVNGWTIQKARELLAYLVAHGGTPVLRETVAEALWPDGDVEQVSHQLSNAAYYLRRTLTRAAGEVDNQVLVTASQRYHLRSGLFRVDVDAFDAHLGRAEKLHGYEALVEYERALALCTADFLGDEIYEWAEVYRRDYQKRFVTAAHRAAKLAIDCRDPKMAIQFYEAILPRDPIDEEAVRGSMRCYAALGDTNAVKRAYKNLVASLRRELEDDNAAPLPETAKLVEVLTTQAAVSR